ncbi:MAG: AAA family ATPase [Pseudomonadales bacterium]
MQSSMVDTKAVKEAVKVTEMEPVGINVQELFKLDEPLPYVPATMMINKNRSPLCEDIVDYDFNPVRRQLQAALLGTNRDAKILCIGDKGTGKTTFIEQLLTRLNRPSVTVNCGEGVTEEYLLGRPTVKAGEVCSADGILSAGARWGINIVLDEVGSLLPEVQISMNDFYGKQKRIVLKHYGLDPTVHPEVAFMQEGSNVIPRHRSFRLWATDNLGGKQGMAGANGYLGTNEINQATRSRLMYLHFNFMAPDQELAVLKSKQMLPNGHALAINEFVLKQMIHFANLFRGHQVSGDTDDTISMRELERWVGNCEVYRGNIDEAFVDAIYTALNPRDQATALNCFEEAIGRELVLTEEHKWAQKFMQA